MHSHKRQVLLGYGTYRVEQIEQAQFVSLLDEAYQAKYDYIDTAAYYKNEAAIGAALQVLKQKYGEKFHFPIQTKIWPEDYLNVTEAVHAALAKLQVPFLDSVLLHRPSPNLAHDLIAWKTLINLKKAGLIKQIGVSNYDNEMLFFFEKVTGVLPAVNQIQFSIYNARMDRYYANGKINVALQAWRPLTFALDKLEQEPIVQNIAKKHNTTVPGVAIGFIKALGIDPIVKSVNPARIKANATAFYQVQLDQSDLMALLSLNYYFDNNNLWGSATYALTDSSVEKLKAEVAAWEKQTAK